MVRATIAATLDRRVARMPDGVHNGLDIRRINRDLAGEPRFAISFHKRLTIVYDSGAEIDLRHHLEGS